MRKLENFLILFYQILRSEPRSNTGSLRTSSINDHVCEPHSRSELTTSMYIRMSHRHYICLKLVNSNGLFYTRRHPIRYTIIKGDTTTLVISHPLHPLPPVEKQWSPPSQSSPPAAFLFKRSKKTHNLL